MFNFLQNLFDPKIEELTSLLSSLLHVHQSPSFLDERVWSLTPLGPSSMSSFIKALLASLVTHVLTSFAPTKLI